MGELAYKYPITSSLAISEQTRPFSIMLSSMHVNFFAVYVLCMSISTMYGSPKMWFPEDVARHMVVHRVGSHRVCGLSGLWVTGFVGYRSTTK